MQTEKPRQPSRAAYQARRRAQTVDLYFRSVEELEAFKGLAHAAGYKNFNAWLLQMLANATSGAVYPPEYVDGLRRDLDRAREWLEAARDEVSDYRSQVRLLQQQRDALAAIVHKLGDATQVAKILGTREANA